MSIASEFNALNGMIVTRKDLEKLLEKAERERHTIISKRVIKVLEGFKDDTFLIEIKNLVEPFGLNGVDTDDITGLLAGLEFIPQSEDIGLGKPVSPNDIYDMITQKMIDLIKNADAKDYKRAWKTEGYIVPYNFVSKKAYRGVNNLMLMPMIGMGMLDNPYFLTFKQVQALGGKVKKGSHGHEVIYYSNFKKEYTEAEIEYINSKVKDIEGAKEAKEGDGKNIFFLKYYNVFNGADIEGIDFDLDNFPLHGKVVFTDVEAGKNEPIEIAEAIVANYPKPQVPLVFGGSSAGYIPSSDSIKMPSLDKFKTSQDYYRTLFHELSHSTAHENRLKRVINFDRESKEYAFEELIAEFGAVFLSAQAGIMFYTNKNHAGYLKGWNERLLPVLENDNRFLMRASSQAQKSTDFILQPDADGNFLFARNGGGKAVEKAVANKVVKTKSVATKKEPVATKTVKTKAVAKAPLNKTQLSLFEGLNGSQNPAWFPKYKQFKNKPKEAIKHLLKVKKGDCLQALYRSDIGFIDIVWGENDSKNKGFGLKHIVEKHGKEIEQLGFKVEDFLPIVIQNGQFEISEQKGGRILLEGSMFRVVIRKSDEKTFLLTAFDLRPMWKKEKSSGLNGTYDGINFANKPLLYSTLDFKKLGKPNKMTDGVSFTKPPLYSKTSISNSKDTTKGLNAPKEVSKNATNQNSLAYKMANKPKNTAVFKIDDTDISEFLGDIERKTKESVVVSLTGGQGSMKTRMCFQFMNALAQNYKVGHASIEEHPESGVYYDKAEQYLNAKALHNIEAPEVKNIADLENLIRKNDVIVIDSFTKLQEMHKGFEIDKDLRKKHNGKLFIVIFQQTTDGKMRGGSKSQFDADVVLFTEKKDDYRQNYIYADKNRYQNKPLDGLKFNIFNKKLQRNEPEATAEPQKVKLSFNVN